MPAQAPLSLYLHLPFCARDVQLPTGMPKLELFLKAFRAFLCAGYQSTLNEDGEAGHPV